MEKYCSDCRRWLKKGNFTRNEETGEYFHIACPKAEQMHSNPKLRARHFVESGRLAYEAMNFSP